MINASQQSDPRRWRKWAESGALGWIEQPRCNQEIFDKGDSIAALDARSVPAERWVRLIAVVAQARIDWHYSGGVAHVLHLGDSASRVRVVNEMMRYAPKLRGRLLHIYQSGEPGLYRSGVTVAPEGAVAAYSDGGRAVFMVA